MCFHHTTSVEEEALQYQNLSLLSLHQTFTVEPLLYCNCQLILNMSSFNAQYIETTSCCGLRQGFSSEFKQEDVDAILVQGMQDLSFDELQREQEDLHGVGDLIDRENQREMDSLLKAFDDYIQCRKKNTVYESAEMLDHEYVRNPDLRMQFLHGHRWVPNHAAEQFLKFLEIKKQLFGMDKVVKDITLDDLDEDDKENLLGGSLQILPTTDRSGRKIVLELPGLRRFKSLKNELRARFFMLMTLRTSKVSRGAVWISYAVGQYRDKMNGTGFVEMTTLGMCMPMHCAGIHLCTGKLNVVTVRLRKRILAPSDSFCTFFLPQMIHQRQSSAKLPWP